MKRGILIRLSEQQLAEIDKKKKQAGIKSREAFIRKMIFDGRVINIDTSSITRVAYLLSNVANNVNQIAKIANGTRTVSVADLQYVKDEVCSVSEEIRNVIKAMNAFCKGGDVYGYNLD